MNKITPDKNKEYQTRWIEKNPIKHKEQTTRKFEKYYCSTKGRVSYLLNNAKQRAKKNNLSFDLTSDWLTPKIENGVCEVTGLPFSIVINGGKGHTNNSFSPSLERKDNTKGYTQDNVQVVCWIYNRAKGAFPIEDLLTMLNALNSQQNQ